MDRINFVEKRKKHIKTVKVLFSSHADDFKKYFESIVNDIANIHDCSIYYLEDQNYYPANEELDNYYSYLKDVCLLVIPITKKYLLEKNRAREIDFEYAQKNSVPILPILVEPGIYDLANENQSIQLLDKTTNDPTQESYREKLKKFLNAVLVDNETANKVRQAFEAYIFLSYRKKDRKHAQEVMSLIHKNGFLRDIAIWYDEYLTPGEDFNDEIEKNLLKSKLMALVVTPNINEKNKSKGNYVIEYEYPKAISKNITVVPIQAVDTDEKELKNNFTNISKPIKKTNSKAIASRFRELLFVDGLRENNDPEHLYFIGLAYLYGIDVERNATKGLSILKRSAKSNFLPAIKELVNIFDSSSGTIGKYDDALVWQKKVIKLSAIDDMQYYKELINYGRLLETHKYDANKIYEKALKFITKKCGKNCKESIAILMCFNFKRNINGRKYETELINAIFKNNFDYKEQYDLLYSLSYRHSYTLSKVLREAVYESSQRNLDEIKSIEYKKIMYTLLSLHDSVIEKGSKDYYSNLINISKNMSLVDKNKAKEIIDNCYQRCIEHYGENSLLINELNLFYINEDINNEDYINAYKKSKILLKKCEKDFSCNPIIVDVLNCILEISEQTDEIEIDIESIYKEISEKSISIYGINNDITIQNLKRFIDYISKNNLENIYQNVASNYYEIINNYNYKEHGEDSYITLYWKIRSSNSKYDCLIGKVLDLNIKSNKEEINNLKLIAQYLENKDYINSKKIYKKCVSLSIKQIGIDNSATKIIIRRFIRLLVRNADSEELENIINLCKTTSVVEEYYTFIGNIYAQYKKYNYSIMYETMALQELKRKHHESDKRIVKSEKLIKAYQKRQENKDISV